MGAARYFFDGQGRRVPDPYEVLGVGREAGLTTIQERYRALVREHPPESDPERFGVIQAAYRRLTDPREAILRVVGEVEGLDPQALGLRAEPPAPAGPRIEDEWLIYGLLHSLPWDDPQAQG